MAEQEAPTTPRVCPACGFDGPRPTCPVCLGAGRVTEAQLQAWTARQRARQTTSSQRDVPTETRKALDALKERRTAQSAGLIPLGEALLEELETANRAGLPPDMNLARRLGSWLSAARSVVNRER